MKTKYGLIMERKPEFPVRDLLRVPHQGKDLIVSYPAFGPNYSSENIKEMQKTYLHPLTKKKISFRESTIAESISASAYKFRELAKPKIFDDRWLQAGRIVKTPEGIFANPPKDEWGRSVIENNILKQYLNKAKKVNGIYLVPNGEFGELRDFGFAPYESFKQGEQSGKDFAVNLKTNGLARVLEHTENKVASKLKLISSKQNYSKGVNIFNFNYFLEPITTLLNLDNGWNYRDILDIYSPLGNEGNKGYAFGICTPIANK